jgi:CheY-like chemotaxis protein
MVLVVDDNPDIARAMEKLLRQAGLDAVSVTEPKVALKVLAEVKPSVIILDNMMPEMDGIEVLKAIRADPQFATVPVLIYSADHAPELYEKAKELGAADVLSKTKTDFPVLIERVRSLADRGSA